MSRKYFSDKQKVNQALLAEKIMDFVVDDEEHTFEEFAAALAILTAILKKKGFDIGAEFLEDA